VEKKEPSILESVDLFINDEIPFGRLLNSLIITSFFIYGLKIFSFLLSIDEELHATRNTPFMDWIWQGRWGMFLLNKCFFPFAILPVMPISFAIFFYILGTTLLFRLFSSKLTIISYFAVALSLAFPSLIFIFSFSSISYGIGFGVFLVGLAFVAREQRRFRWDCLAAALFCFSIAIYQSLLLLILSIFLLSWVGKSIKRTATERPVDFREILNDSTRFSITMVAACLVYLAIQKFLLFELNLQIQYVDGFFHPADLLMNPWLIFNKSLVDLFSWLITGRNEVYIDRLTSFSWLIRLCISLVLYKIVRQRSSWVTRLILIFFFVCSIYAPFILHLLNRGEMPARSLIALPFVAATIIYLGFQSSNRSLRILILLMSAFVLFRFGVIDNRYQNATNVALEADRLLANRIIDRMDHLNLPSTTTHPFELVGFLARDKSFIFLKKETLGASFFEWDAGNPGRVISFLKILGYTKLKGLSYQERLSLVPYTKEMPSWPADGSLKTIKGVIVLKLGEYSDYQKFTICEGLNKAPNCF
jgi:hypothetical protein